MTPEEKYKLIARNTQEIVGEEELRELLKKRNLKVYLGTAITGKPHVGYFVPAMKIRDFLNAECEVTILLADLHALLDDLKTPFELLDARYEYYKEVLTALFRAVGAKVEKLKFVRGRDFQLGKEYTLDAYKLASICSLHDCQKAAAEVVRFGDNPRLGGFIYPIMQALDEQYLGVDAQYGGVDQRKILMFARENLPKIGYKQRIEIMTPMVPGLQGAKMSSSDESSKIDLLDDEKTIKSKMNKAFCPEGQVEGNGVLSFAEHVIMHMLDENKESLVIERPEKFGGNVSYKDYKSLEKDFVAKKLHPMDLKNAVAREMVNILEIVREDMRGKEGLAKKAYP